MTNDIKSYIANKIGQEEQVETKRKYSADFLDKAINFIVQSNLEDKNVRFIIDDCKKFVQREIRRGNRYDAIIMDPPSYGRGPSGEIWKIEENLFDFVSLCFKLLSENSLFVLINSYTTGLQPQVLKNILLLNSNFKGNCSAYEVGLPTDEKIVLPCGASGLLTF